MKMMNRTKVNKMNLFGLNRVLFLILVTAIISNTSAHATFELLSDLSENRFLAKIKIDTIKFTIGRVKIDGPYYDGFEGYTVIFVRQSYPDMTQENEEVFTFLVKGQYSLAGFDAESKKIYSFKYAQIGAVWVISGLVEFDKKHPDGLILQPTEYYQYGSVSPGGGHCLLIANKIVQIDLKTKSWIKIDSSVKLSGEEADPDRNGSIAGNADLSNKNLEVRWISEEKCELIIRENKDKTRTYLINLATPISGK